MNEIDFMLLERYLTSIKYTIPTKPIMDLKAEIEKWMSNSNCGAIIYGRPRIGKTRAIKYISESLRIKYGHELPIYVWNATDHKPSDKFFYSELLKTVGHAEVHKGTTLMLKERLINSLTFAALETKYRKIVLFIDEAYLLSEKDFIWLMDIYNNLNLYDIQIIVFLVGSNELKQLKNVFCKSGKAQIVGRFMVDEFTFKGISSLKEVSICLMSMDKPFIYDNEKEIILSQLFFPYAYSDGYKLVHMSEDIWNAFIKLMKKYSIRDTDIPMKYFMDSVVYCLKHYGFYGKKLYFPNINDIENSIVSIGYIKAENVGVFNEDI